MAGIRRLTLATGNDYSFSLPSATGADYRVLIRASENVRVALDEADTQDDARYFSIASGTTLVLDPPNYLPNALLWFRLDSAASGIVEVWCMEGVY